MDFETAKNILLLDENNTEQAIRSAYIERVKELKETPDFEQQLQQLNVARDHLLESSSESKELAPILARELATIAAKQTELVLRTNAQEEIRDSFNAIEKRAVNSIKGARDLTGLLSAASAVLAFGRDNFSDLFPQVEGSNLYSQTLLLTSATFAFVAFMANRRANAVASVMDEINQMLTKDRQISRLLRQIYSDQTSLPEREFEDQLSAQIRSITGTYRKPSATYRVLELYGMLGLPVPLRIYLGDHFTDDYFDYLIKSGHLKTTGTSGNDMMIHRVL